MKVSVLMPQLGLTMTEGTVSEWHKQPGDAVKKGEFLFTVSTDKADMEVESVAEGVLSDVMVEVGKTVPVGTVIAYLDKPGEEVSPSESSPESSNQKSAPESVPSVTTSLEPESKILNRELSDRTMPAASPRARRAAKELRVDLASVQGTGTTGRIVEEDIRRAAQTRSRQGTGKGERRRQLIAEKMISSAETIPHFTVWAEAKAEALLALLKSLKGPVEDSAGVKLTVTDLLLKSLAIVLAETSEMNTVWEGGRICPCDSVDLGLAIATEEGVVGPVIHAVDKLNVGALAQIRKELADKARQRRLSFRDLEGGVGTLSNLGMYRIDQFQALITPGQSFVLAVGQIRQRPWVEEAGLEVRSTIILNLSVDHRVADGAVAAEFLRKVVDNLENPYRLLWQFRETGGKEGNW